MPKKYTRFINSINFGSFFGYCMFSIGFSYDELIDRIKEPQWKQAISEDKEKIDNAHACALFRELENRKTGETRRYYYIFIRDPFKFTDEDYIKLSHECLHICQFYLPKVLDRNREIEAEAYLHSHLMQQCLNIIRNKK